MGIEVKYHENLRDKEAKLTERHEEVAVNSEVFIREQLVRLKKKPLEQIWRDHLVALSMLQADDKWTQGTFVYLAPGGNIPCAKGAAEYAACLTDKRTFEYWKLESLVSDISTKSNADWIRKFEDRYLGFEKIDAIRQREYI
jgi:hypothetical protein